MVDPVCGVPTVAQCDLEDGRPWMVLVEKQNRITQNDRHPLMPNWSFCKFLDEYGKPEYHNMLYLVTAITEPGLRLRRRLKLPDPFACDELYKSLYDARMWMSQGNTTVRRPADPRPQTSHPAPQSSR